MGGGGGGGSRPEDGTIYGSTREARHGNPRAENRPIKAIKAYKSSKSHGRKGLEDVSERHFRGMEPAQALHRRRVVVQALEGRLCYAVYVMIDTYVYIIYIYTCT